MVTLFAEVVGSRYNIDGTGLQQTLNYLYATTLCRVLKAYCSLYTRCSHLNCVVKQYIFVFVSPDFLACRRALIKFRR
jgi:hypothetical protein